MRSSSVALSKSPSASSSAFLQSIIPAPVSSRSFLTSAAVIATFSSPSSVPRRLRRVSRRPRPSAASGGVLGLGGLGLVLGLRGPRRPAASAPRRSPRPWGGSGVSSAGLAAPRPRVLRRPPAWSASSALGASAVFLAAAPSTARAGRLGGRGLLGRGVATGGGHGSLVRLALEQVALPVGQRLVGADALGVSPPSLAPERAIRPSATASAITRVSRPTARMASSLPGIG